MPDYDARLRYLDDEIVAEYEQERFGSRLGRYVWAREQRGVGRTVADAGPAERILDCPSGNGRWVPVLQQAQPSLIVEADISPAMLAAARARGRGVHPVLRGSASNLPFEDDTFDLVFCHALTKHLEPDAQRAVVLELARVSKGPVVCSFSVLQGLGGLVRRIRRSGGVPVTKAWLAETARLAGLRVARSRPCTTPIGAERSILLVPA